MATETLRPNAPGDECTITQQTGAACPNHYQNVDDVGHDGYGSVVEEREQTYHRDLYNLQDSGVGVGTINFVKVYAVCLETDAGYVKVAIKSGGVANEGGEQALTGSWASYSGQWNTPPEGGSWDWDKIDALQAGIALKAGTNKAPSAQCTQVYVEVDYTLIPRHGFVLFQDPGIV